MLTSRDADWGRMGIELQFVRVEEDEANLEQRAIIRLFRGDDRNPVVKLHMPHLTYWSDTMAIDDAAKLIRRDASTANITGTVEVIDPNNLWPTHWLALRG